MFVLIRIINAALLVMESRSRTCSISGLLKILLIFIMNCSMCKQKS